MQPVLAPQASRSQRRQRQAKAAKVYGIKGILALDIHAAYRALAQKDLHQAVQLVLPISESHPGNEHAWIILGGAALEQREGATALAFLRTAERITPKDPVVLGGLAKAHVLEAEVETAVTMMARAFKAGLEDKALIILYLELMQRLGRQLSAVKIVSAVVVKMKDAALSLQLAYVLMEGDEINASIAWFERAHRLDPAPETHQIGRLRGLLFACKFEAMETGAQALLKTVKACDTVLVIYVMGLRLMGRHAQAIEMIENHKFTDMEEFALAQGVLANIYQDIGPASEVEPTFIQAMHITGDKNNVAKALGIYRFRMGDYIGGYGHFAERFGAKNRARVPLKNAEPDNLRDLKQLYVMGEQGVGDQLALLSLLRAAPLEAAAGNITLISDARLGPVLAGNTLGVGFLSQDEFAATPYALAAHEVIYLGDLSRYLGQDGTHSAPRGGYLRADPKRLAHLQKKYRARAKGRPIIGLAWRSSSMMGYLRSVALLDLLAALPRRALVINLQYGDTAAEIAAAKKHYPDIEIYTDPEVDQMVDLVGFCAQIAATQRVITIDNTTAHACGALGHGDSHVLIPMGAECMWYWGDAELETATADGRDPWYQHLHLHRQSHLQDWQAPLAALTDLTPQVIS